MCGALVGIFIVLFSGLVQASEPLTIGILAFRGEAETSAQWKPLETYLNAAAPEFTFTVKAMSYRKLGEAVRQSQVDLVIAQPAMYVRLTHENGLSSPLATLLNTHDGKPVRVFGGTILARSEDVGINTLMDLNGKRVAAASKSSFAGYQAQAHALQKQGVSLAAVAEMGESQDLAIAALLEGRVDAAFVRSGLMESLIREGKLAFTRIKVVNEQAFPGYPFAVSTALYPEWPMFALPHVPDGTVARVAGAVLSLPHDGAVAREIGITGFSVPSDYDSVREVMRSLKVAPFDAEDRITLAQVWQQYRAMLLLALTSVMAISIFAVRATWIGRRFKELNDTLEVRITKRTAELSTRNDELDKTVNELNLTRDELVESAKLAALGSMVAGIAHELNTPIGNGLTVASSFEDYTKEFQKELGKGLSRSTLDTYVANAADAGSMLVSSLHKAATLISSFKQVAVDQTSSQRRNFQLHDTLEEVVLMLSPTVNRSGCTVRLIEQDSDIEFDSYPGPLGQVIANLINNSIVHGYAEGPPGEIRVVVSRAGLDCAKVEVADDGHGISATNLPHIFEPFFTTRLGKGGSGLGLSIARNLVTGTLGGKLTVKSTLGQGAAFTLTAPLIAPAPVPIQPASQKS